MQTGRNSKSRTIEVYDLLPPEPAQRRQPMRHARPVLVEDAVFEVVATSAATRPADRHARHPYRQQNDNPARPTKGKKPDFARHAAVAGVFVVNRLERLLSGLTTQAFATLIASLFFVVFWLCGGFSALVSQPAAAPRLPFAIEQVFTEEIDQNGMRLLAVGGVLRNHSGSSMAAPALSVMIEGGEIVGTIPASASNLATGQSVRFFGRFKLAGGKSGAVTIFPAGT